MGSRRALALVFGVGFACPSAQVDFGSPKELDSMTTASSVDAADLDGDGDAEILAASFGEGRVAWFENLDVGTFGAPQDFATLSGARGVRAHDLDGDGDQDVAVAAWNANVFAWYENVGGAAVISPVQRTVGSASSPNIAEGVDLDGDGDADLLTASYNDDTVGWYANIDGLGTFGPRQILSATSDGAADVWAADVDGDGDLDVLAASDVDTTLAWFANVDGAASFGAKQTIDGGLVDAYSVRAFDADADGDADVVCGRTSADTLLFANDGAANFAPGQVAGPPAGGPGSVQVSDIDRDGDEDLVIPSVFSDTITWQANDGAGNFSPGGTIDLPSGPWGLFAGDTDGDGDPDVATALWFGGRVLWYENLHAPLSGDPAVISLAAGGKQDFVLLPGPQHQGRVYLLLGTTTGTSPGFPLDDFQLPLNVDLYTIHTLTHPNKKPLANSLGVVDPTGAATASFELAPLGPPELVGLTLHHAYFVADVQPTNVSIVFVSNAVALALEP